MVRKTLLIAFLALIIVGCGDTGSPQTLIVGAWVQGNTTVKFTNTGDYVENNGISITAGKYEITGQNALTLRSATGAIQNTITISDQELSITDAAGSATTYQRSSKSVDLSAEESMAISQNVFK